jgi:hypothetical protein
MTDIEQLLIDHLDARGRAVRVDDDLEAILDPTQVVVRTTSPHRSRRRMQAGLAAAAIAGLGLGALAWRGTSQPSTPAASAPDESAPQSSPPATSRPSVTPSAGGARTLLPPDLAAFGLRLTRTGLVSVERTEPEGFQRRLYSRADAPDDPAGMVLVEVSKDLNGGAVTCQRVDGAEPFDIADGTGWTCTQGSNLSAGWALDGAIAEVWAGSAVTRDELIAFAHGLQPVPSNATIDGAPPISLEPSPLPAGWVTLVDEDVAYAQDVTETAWVATASGDDGDAQQLWIKTWTGVDDDAEALYAINPPIQSQRVTVRGNTGYLFESTQQGENGPLQIQLSWIESPGVVVTLVTDDLGPADQLLDSLAAWTQVTPSEFEAAMAD